LNKTADEGEFRKRDLVNRKMNRAVILVQTKTQIINILCGFSSIIFWIFSSLNKLLFCLTKLLDSFLLLQFAESKTSFQRQKIPVASDTFWLIQRLNKSKEYRFYWHSQ